MSGGIISSVVARYAGAADEPSMSMSIEQYRQVIKKKTKFKNIRCIASDGAKFESVLEKDYYELLVMLWHQGQVCWFTRQVPFWLEGGVKYVADFLVVTPTGFRVVDTTGVMTPTKKNKLKQMRARYGITVEVLTKRDIYVSANRSANPRCNEFSAGGSGADMQVE